MTDPKRHDFARLIAELERAGMTLHTIAKMTRRQFNQVKRWRNGSEPRHYEGEMLLMIHRECVKPPPPTENINDDVREGITKATQCVSPYMEAKKRHEFAKNALLRSYVDYICK